MLHELKCGTNYSVTARGLFDNHTPEGPALVASVHTDSCPGKNYLVDTYVLKNIAYII